MKRARDESMGCDAEGMTPPPSTFWGSISPWKAPQSSVKRRRDRSVPVDALSRMMSAAVTNARFKKHSMKKLFGSASCHLVSCAVCESVGRPIKRQFAATQQCSHCERTMGDCCGRECDACGDAFCSLCSTLNCDEQFDRVFCLSCNQDKSRG
ncbi:hypothetical protein BBJ29_001756 [Phytophthora kernoviae]|uniref:Uncharacterized protein n=1 Tax=Phytophthora kernoviae TaxID=325452 RepID=A0A3F2S3J8_9STRA|nr:hypothetical protein BBJ29_001756 [Phytophthora kernoviae]RLN69499.1 hypothetical protein BBP00_00000305 [Phytophthora kernoviae]